jgi:hypothetical protein
MTRRGLDFLRIVEFEQNRLYIQNVLYSQLQVIADEILLKTPANRSNN